MDHLPNTSSLAAVYPSVAAFTVALHNSIPFVAAIINGDLDAAQRMWDGMTVNQQMAIPAVAIQRACGLWGIHPMRFGCGAAH